jgi:hypothetical protein
MGKIVLLSIYYGIVEGLKSEKKVKIVLLVNL